MMLWDVGQGGVFETHVLLVVIRFDNRTLSIGSISDCKCQLPDEPALVPGWLHAMDGNNSMKHVDSSGHADHCVFISDYLIPSSTIDNFKDDVVTRPGAKNKSSSLLPQGHENEWCADNWTAANPISEGTVNVFQQTGGFLSACRHSIIETLVEMIQSSEL